MFSSNFVTGQKAFVKCSRGRQVAPRAAHFGEDFKTEWLSHWLSGSYKVCITVVLFAQLCGNPFIDDTKSLPSFNNNGRTEDISEMSPV